MTSNQLHTIEDLFLFSAREKRESKALIVDEGYHKDNDRRQNEQIPQLEKVHTALTCNLFTWLESAAGFCVGCVVYNNVVVKYLGREECKECKL